MLFLPQSLPCFYLKNFFYKIWRKDCFRWLENVISGLYVYFVTMLYYWHSTLQILNYSIDFGAQPPIFNCLVSWGCRVCQLQLWRGVRPSYGATCWPWMATCKVLGRDPGGWAVIDLVTVVNDLQYITYPYLVWQAWSDHLADHVKL